MADPCGAEPPEKKKRLDLKTKKRNRLLFSPPVSKQIAGNRNKSETKSLNNPSCIKLSSSMLKVMYGPVLSNEEVKSFPKSQTIQSYEEDTPTTCNPQSNLWTTLPSPDYTHLTRQRLHPLIMEPVDKRGSTNLVSKLNNDFIAVSSNDITNKIPDKPVMKTGLSPATIEITSKNILDKQVIITSSPLTRTSQTTSKLSVNKTGKSGVTSFSSSIQKTIPQQGQARRIPPSSTSLQVGVVTVDDDCDDFDELVKDIDLSVYD